MEVSVYETDGPFSDNHSTTTVDVGAADVARVYKEQRFTLIPSKIRQLVVVEAAFTKSMLRRVPRVINVVPPT
jgi:hypothetical protein